MAECSWALCQALFTDLSHLILTATLGSSHKEGSLCFSILYLRKPRLRKVSGLACGSTFGMWQFQDLTLNLPDHRACYLPTHF